MANLTKVDSCPSELVEALRVQYNKLVADVDDIRTKYAAVVTLVNELKADLSAHIHSGAEGGAVALANDLKAKYNAMVTLTNELKADMSAHVHGGVTAGSVDTSAGATIAAADAVVTAIADASATNVGVGATISAADAAALAAKTTGTIAKKDII